MPDVLDRFLQHMLNNFIIIRERPRVPEISSVEGLFWPQEGFLYQCLQIDFSVHVNHRVPTKNIELSN